MSRREQRASAINELRAMGERARAGRYRPDVYAITSRLTLGSQSMAERLRGTRRLEQRLSFLVPYEEAPPPLPESMETFSGLPPFPGEAHIPQQAMQTHILAGDMLMLVASKMAAALECLNLGAMLGQDELKGLARDFGEAAMRFGLKFRSAVPIWMLEALRQGDGNAMQLAATALLVWSEVENQPFTSEISQGIASLRPIPVQTLDDPQETVELVRLALTASRN